MSYVINFLLKTGIFLQNGDFRPTLTVKAFINGGRRLNIANITVA